MTLAVCLIIYGLAAYTLPLIKVNSDFKNSETGVKLFVISNGVHTDIILPVKTEVKDWTKIFPKDNFSVTDTSYNYISFGWGDKGFYLQTPTWNDLKFSTAFKAAFGLSETAMHVSYVKEKKQQNERCRELKIDSLRYKQLIHFIEASFDIKKDGLELINHPGYGHFDRFYEAKGRYSLFKTCNIWTNNALVEIKVQTALWSPLAEGLMASLPR
jgi:uncharacterized protein (TIGR02117 family)